MLTPAAPEPPAAEEGAMNISQFIVPIITGLASGMLIYLTASGMSLIISGMGTINFSQGSFYILGAMICFNAGKFVPFGLALAAGFLVTFLLGIFVETALRPVFGKEMTFSMIVTMAIMYIMGDVMQGIWGTSIRVARVPKALSHVVRLGSVMIPGYYLFIIGISTVTALVFWIMFYKTRLGMYFRAIINDRNMVECLGVNVQIIFSLMFMIGIGMAGTAGALNSPLSGIQTGQSMNLFSSVMPVLIIGGMNNMKGALPAALLLGVAQAISAIFLPTYYNIVPSIIMIVVMLVKPEGLFVKGGAVHL
jgi:branched-subunit amino acid ABC-type transport system permease component